MPSIALLIAAVILSIAFAVGFAYLVYAATLHMLNASPDAAAQKPVDAPIQVD